MSSRAGNKGAVLPGLKPSFVHDSNGWCIPITCGSLSGYLYVNKLDESKKSLGKCILAKGVWHSPPEFEALGGKRSKRWRQSLLYLGRPLSDYDLTCPRSQPPPAGSSSGVSSGAASVAVGNVATSAACTPVTPLSSQDNVLTSQSSDRENIPSPPQPMLVNSVLSFIKAFRLRSDKDSLKRVVADRFSSADVDGAKRAFWNFCHDELVAAKLPFHARRDSDKRSQLSADLEDIIVAFDTLDSTDSIPLIYCEANDLLFLPPLSLDPTADQVQQNTNILQSLVSQVENLEKKLSSVCSSSQSASSFSYAQAASSQPNPPVHVTHSARLSSTKSPSVIDSRACNLVLFGLPENDSILKLKSEIDEVLEFLAGKQVTVNDVFRLGKFSASSNRPRPVLIKLATAWDRKVILLRKRDLKDFKTSRLFLREDVPPDHKLRQRGRVLGNVVRPSPPPSASLEPGNVLSSSSSAPQIGKNIDISCTPNITSDMARSDSSPVLHPSSSTITTVLQGPADHHDDST